MLIWTKEDETKLQEMLERKMSIQNTLRECVRRAVSRLIDENLDTDCMTNILIENATVFRKVLEAFDPEFKQ